MKDADGTEAGADETTETRVPRVPEGPAVAATRELDVLQMEKLRQKQAFGGMVPGYSGTYQIFHSTLLMQGN